MVHVLVAHAFLGPRPEGLEVRHLDGDKLNPCIGNLAYGTRLENAADTLRHGHNKNASKTECKHGHAFDEVNTGLDSNGHRYCKTCAWILSLARYHRNKEARGR